jgi:hypothetical protein
VVFPAPLRTEQAEADARRDGEIETVDGDPVAEVLRDVRELDDHPDRVVVVTWRR